MDTLIDQVVIRLRNTMSKCQLLQDREPSFDSSATLLAASKARAEVLTNKSSQYYVGSYPGLGKLRGEREADSSAFLNLVLDLHLRRATQVATAVLAGVSVDGPFKDHLDETLTLTGEWDGWIMDLASLDIHELMLSWVKETTVYAVGRCLQQTELNTVSCTTMLEACVKKIGDRSWLRPGRLGPGDLTRFSLWLMSPLHSVVGANSFMLTKFRIAENVLYLKRVCPPMLEHKIQEELQKHKKRVCRDPSGVPKPDTVRQTLVHEAIDQICDRIFEGVQFVPELSSPSLSASFENGRSQDGQFGQFLKTVPSAGALLEFVANPLYDGDVLQYMTETRPGHVVELRQPYRTQVMVQAISAGYSEQLRKWLSENDRIKVKPFPIVEPAKIRTITLGEEIPYIGLKAIQTFLWKQLKHLRTFELTGSPLTDVGMDTVLDASEAAALLRDGWLLVSADYSAATDNLNPHYCDYVWGAISKRVRVMGLNSNPLLRDTPWYKLGSLGLTGHRIHYPFVEGEEVVDQTWGQLMGSPVSFPILNIINAATTAAAMHMAELQDSYENILLGLQYLDSEVSEQRQFVYNPANFVGPTPFRVLETLERYHVRTNGDDLFFICPDRIAYATWNKFVREVGLEPSLGKNYTSRSFMIVNSEMRVLERLSGPVVENSPTDVLWRWQFERFANLPILMGVEAKGLEAGQSVLDRIAFFDLSTLSRALVEGIDKADPRFARRLERFEAYHKKVLDRIPNGMDKYIPQSLGGVGIPNWPNRQFTHLLSLRRAAWLTTLKLRDWARAVTPPSYSSPNKLTVGLKAAMMHQAIKYECVTYVDELLGGLAEHQAKMVAGSTFYEYVRLFGDDLLEIYLSSSRDDSLLEDWWSRIFPAADDPLLDEDDDPVHTKAKMYRRQVRREEKTVREIRENRYRREINKQLTFVHDKVRIREHVDVDRDMRQYWDETYVRKPSIKRVRLIEPMRQESIEAWAPVLLLQERSIQPHYEAPIEL